ncbi:MAG: hypothetical protein COA94_01570 [Rickettsiales bacterium]|nr:MAG: hypothetical protein COA94_01570 [Rickettsiales bacterium]
MIKRSFKHFLKNSALVHELSACILFLYLKLVYITTSWEFVWEDGISPEIIRKEDGILFAMWHNRLAFGMYIYKDYENVYALVSSHTDGKLITDVIRKMKYSVIEGSTNRNPTGAVRGIIKAITNGGQVVITPDGPRGPVYKINSNITKLGHKYSKAVIPVSCMASKYFRLKSWDGMMIPKPFGRVVVTIARPLPLSGDDEKDSKSLEEALTKLSAQASCELQGI